MDTQKTKRRLCRIVVPAFSAFNIYSKVAVHTTALGPICVATSASEVGGWDVEVVDENNYNSKRWPTKNGLPDHFQLQSNRPADVVGFYGSLSSTIPRLYELSALYRSLKVTTIAGGKHIEALPEEALSKGIDFVVFGEGDDAIQEFLRSWDCWNQGSSSRSALGHIAGLGYLDNDRFIRTAIRPLAHSFEHLPKPNFGLLRYHCQLKLYPINRVRGCNMLCEFCAVKDRARAASPQSLVEQIASLVESRNARHFFIVDDHFGADPKGAIEFCHLITDYQKRHKLKLRFSVQIRLNDAKKTDLLVAMKNAGVTNVFIGYESPIDEELKAMNKLYDFSHMVEWIQIFRQYGFWIHGMFIFGYPNRVEPGMDPLPQLSLDDRVKHFRRFIKQAKIDTVQILLTVPLPGTALRDRLERDGRLYSLDELGWQYYDGQFPLFEPDNNVSPEELQRAVTGIMSRFYHVHHAWKVILRTLYFPLAMIPAFSIKDLKANFGHWSKGWKRDLVKFGASRIVAKWLRQFRQDDFLERLQRAKSKLKQPSKTTHLPHL